MVEVKGEEEKCWVENSDRMTSTNVALLLLVRRQTDGGRFRISLQAGH